MHCKVHIMHCGSLAAHTEDVFDIHFALKRNIFLNPHPLKTKAYFVTKGFSRCSWINRTESRNLSDFHSYIFPIFYSL